MEGPSREWLEKAGEIEDECPHVGCGAMDDRDAHNAWVEDLQEECTFVPLREFLEQLKERLKEE